MMPIHPRKTTDIEIITVDRLIPTDDVQALYGEFIPDRILNQSRILDHDADVYTSTGKLLAKFRKNVIPPELCELAREQFLKAARVSYNRGAAAGPIDMSKLPKDVLHLRPRRSHERGVKSTKNYTYYVRTNGLDAKNQLSNGTRSGLVGYYEKARGLPCRLTGFTRAYFDRYQAGLPFFQHLSNLFRELIPESYKRQRQRALETPNFIIPDTAFSTVTVNHNFPTAIHKDAGDFEAGFGNLTCIGENYEGAHTVFPEWGIGFDVRTGDFLAMNVHEFHGNSPLAPLDTTREPLRLTFVCYLRKLIQRCEEATTTEPLETALAPTMTDKQHEDDVGNA
jgi:hypothetical protein